MRLRDECPADVSCKYIKSSFVETHAVPALYWASPSMQATFPYNAQVPCQLFETSAAVKKIKGSLQTFLHLSEQMMHARPSRMLFCSPSYIVLVLSLVLKEYSMLILHQNF